MKNIIFCSVAIAAFAISLSACRHDPDLTNAPTIHYSTEIQPLIGGKCGMAGCHSDSQGNGEHAEPIVTYKEIMDHDYVKQGDANGSKLYQAITGRNGAHKMPPSGSAQLTRNDVLKIFLWIEEGALDN